MKKLALLLFGAASLCCAQSVHPFTAYVNPTGTPNGWGIWNAAAGSGFIGNQPPGAYLYCGPSASGPLSPCTGNGGGGNPATPNWNAALLKVKNGTGSARVLAVGDSTTYGYCSTSTPTVSNCFATGQSYNLFSYPHQLCTFITTNYGIKCEDDGFFGSGEGTTYAGLTDSRIVMGSSWSQDTSVLSLGAGTYKATTNTNAFVFTPISTVDTFEVYFVQDTTEGACSVSINGGGATVVNTNGAAAFLKQTYTTTAAAGNFISISESSGTCHLVGIVATNSTIAQVVVMNSGAVAANASQIWSTVKAYGGGMAQVFSAVAPNLVINDVGINDWLGATPLATYTSQYQGGLSAELASGSDLAIKTPIPSGTAGTPTPATQSSYVEATRALAVTNANVGAAAYPLPFIDWFDSVKGSTSVGYTYGLGLGYYPTPNETHYNQYGYAAIADFTAAAIIPPLSQAFNEQRLNSFFSGVQAQPSASFLSVTVPDPSFGSSMAYKSGACELNYGITTLSTTSTNTFTGQSCIPANAVVMAIVYRITTTITGATSFTIGSSTGVPNKYCTTQSTLTAGTVGTCLAGWSIAGNVVAALPTAPIIQSNVIPTAGAMRVIAYYVVFTPPTS